jgi:flavorubredoxin
MDLKTNTLFSGDIFGAFSVDWHLFANENYIEAMRIFHEPYIAHNDVIDHFAKKVKELDLPIKMVAPQHGSVIKEKDVGKCLQALTEFEVGTWIL